jgi:hypothetical protein
MANLPSCDKPGLPLVLEHRNANPIVEDRTEDEMKRFVIEREIPKVGSLNHEQLQKAATKSNEVLRQLGPNIQWVESYIAADKRFCVYLGKDEEIIHRHAELSGFPATKVTEVGKIIDSTTGE